MFGRYVRFCCSLEIDIAPSPLHLEPNSILTLAVNQDREAEPRFTGPPSARGGYEGGLPRGGGFGYGGGAPSPSSGGRQIFVNNVCLSPSLYYPSLL